MLQSVLYAALFEYPLTTAQLRQALLGAVADEATLLRWFHTSAYLQRALDYADGHFFPKGRHDLLATRRRREASSHALLADLAHPLDVISRMPFVRMVALSGSLAHCNAESDADLDVFVITRAHRVWTTTVLTLAIARLCGWRRRLCLNYVISEHALWVAPADLFSANQIVHLRPITGGAVYRRFIDANRFVRRFYPNFEPALVVDASLRQPWYERLLNATIGAPLEHVCRLLYRAHLRRRAHTWASRDQVRLEAECLKLHTQSHRREVMERFERAIGEAAARAEVAPVSTATAGESPRLQALM
jgi:hypothetical protein